MSAEQRMEIRRTFIEGQGYLVEEVPINAPSKPGQVAVKTIVEPPKTMTPADVSPELARQVLEQAGFVVVPHSFLNPEQLQELGITPSTGAPELPTTGAAEQTTGKPADTQTVKAGKMPVEQIIALINQADSFDKLNALMADETRKTAINAAEARAEVLKAEGAK